ncbi:Uncharacterized protein APZ42_001124 [Daphnia magna]|uniref:Uncharacterized protein n=1 Tax=Daphnia magna TaxID=35525 RepID=A0A164J5T4_9CRUS|nr:Uncharacterized protein APZ42_001124 [Daphnia magna]
MSWTTGVWHETVNSYCCLNGIKLRQEFEETHWMKISGTFNKSRHLAAKPTNSLLSALLLHADEMMLDELEPKLV